MKTKTKKILIIVGCVFIAFIVLSVIANITTTPEEKAVWEAERIEKEAEKEALTSACTLHHKLAYKLFALHPRAIYENNLYVYYDFKSYIIQYYKKEGYRFDIHRDSITLRKKNDYFYKMRDLGILQRGENAWKCYFLFMNGYKEGLN